MRSESKIGEDAQKPWRPAAQQVVAEHPKGMYDSQKLEDMGRVRLLGRRELVTLVGYRVMNTVVIWLGENCRDSNFAGVSRK